MVYETKFPRKHSASTVTEDFSDDSEVQPTSSCFQGFSGGHTEAGSFSLREEAGDQQFIATVRDQ